MSNNSNHQLVVTTPTLLPTPSPASYDDDLRQHQVTRLPPALHLHVQAGKDEIDNTAPQYTVDSIPTSTYSFTPFHSANSSSGAPSRNIPNQNRIPELQGIINQLVGIESVIIPPPAPAPSHDNNINHFIDLNDIPPNFAQYDKKHLAHTTLPFKVSPSPQKFENNTNNNNNNGGDYYGSDGLSNNNNWHPMSSKLSELFYVAAASTASSTDDNAINHPLESLTNPQAASTGSLAAIPPSDSLIRNAAMNTAMLMADSPTNHNNSPMKKNHSNRAHNNDSNASTRSNSSHNNDNQAAADFTQRLIAELEGRGENEGREIITQNHQQVADAPPPPFHHHHHQHQQSASSSTSPSFPSVICSDKDLKALVTAPFVSSSSSRKPLTLFVHRVGETMFLDAGSNNSTQSTTAKSNRANTLASKLVYFSIAASAAMPNDNNNNSETPSRAANNDEGGNDNGASKDPNESKIFNHVLQWRFDDLSALIGTTPRPNLVSMETGGRVSLLLQDVSSTQTSENPHNNVDFILKDDPTANISIDRDEALDMWLDNIMNNIPHVAICCHKDGVVQGFQIVPTGKLPSLAAGSTVDAAAFEPVAVLRHSREVLKWLQASTQEDGSYVLFKDTDDNKLPVLKLFKIRANNAPTSSSTTTTTSATTKSNSATPKNNMRSPKLTASHHLHQQQQKQNSKIRLEAIDDETDDQQQQLHRVPEKNTSVSTATSLSSFPTTTTTATTTRIPEFDVPLALMCFRMAQCLPYTDAEAFRLLNNCLEILEESNNSSTSSSSSSSSFRAMSAIRAVAYVTCAEHLRSSSPLSDSDELCLRYARNAIQPLALILAQQQTEHENNSNQHDDDIIPPFAHEPNVQDTARRLTKQLLVLLTGIAADQQRRQNNSNNNNNNAATAATMIECMKTLALAQGVLMLRRDEVPSGLLMMTTMNNNQIEESNRCAVDKNSPQEATSSSPMPPNDKSILLDITSALDCIVGDLFHSLLMTVIVVASSAASMRQTRQRVEAILKIASVAAQDVAMNELARYYPECCNSNHTNNSFSSSFPSSSTSPSRRKFTYPPQVDFLGHLENFVLPSLTSPESNNNNKNNNNHHSIEEDNNNTEESNIMKLCLVDSICEAGSASYSRAAALMSNYDNNNSITNLQQKQHRETIHREITRKLAGLESQVATFYLQLATSSAAATVALRYDRIGKFLQDSLDKFDRARQLFASVLDERNSTLMILNMAKVKLRCAEQAFKINNNTSNNNNNASGGGGGAAPSAGNINNNVVSFDELKQLLSAVQMMVNFNSILKSEAFPTSSSTISGASSTIPHLQEYKYQYRLQFIQLCLLCATRCLTVVGPDVRGFDRDKTFSLFHSSLSSSNLLLSPTSTSSSLQEQFDPTLHPFRLIMNLQRFILNEFLIPADKVAKKMSSSSCMGSGDQGTTENNNNNNVNQQHQQIQDIRARIHLMIAELASTLGCGIRHPLAQQNNNLMMSQQQQSYLGFIHQNTKLLKIANWAEKEVEDSANSSSDEATLNSSTSSTSTAEYYSLATTHFKLALEMGLTPTWRRGVIVLYLLDVQIKKMKCNIAINNNNNNNNNNIGEDSLENATMKSLSLFFDLLSPWVQEEELDFAKNNQQQQQNNKKKENNNNSKSSHTNTKDNKRKEQQESAPSTTSPPATPHVSASLILPRITYLLMNILKLATKENNNSPQFASLKDIVTKLIKQQQQQQTTTHTDNDDGASNAETIEAKKRQVLLEVIQNLPSIFMMRKK